MRDRKEIIKAIKDYNDEVAGYKDVTAEDLEWYKLEVLLDIRDLLKELVEKKK